MTIIRKTTGAADNDGGSSTVQTGAMNVAVGDLILLFVEGAGATVATAVDTTATNSYAPVTGGGDVTDGSMHVTVLRCIATAANAACVATATKDFGLLSIAWAQYSTDSGGWTFGTLASDIPAFGDSTPTTPPFDLTGAGVAVAAAFNSYQQACTFTATNSLTARTTIAGASATPGPAARAKQVQDNIYTSAQTGLIAGVSDTVGDRSAIVAVTFLEAGDTTPPTLSSPTGTSTGSSTATVGATTDEGNGTLYAVVTTSATQPTVAQIKAGQNDGGTAAVWSGTQAVASTGAKTLNATGLTASTTYYAHLVQADAASNNSNRVSSASFTTSAPPASGAPIVIWW